MQSSSAPIKISDSEWEIMRVIWTLGKSDAQEVTALLSESKDWKTATVKTLLGRLVKKRRIADRNPRKKICLLSFGFRGCYDSKCHREFILSYLCKNRPNIGRNDS